VFDTWYQILVDGEEIGNMSQAEDTTWTVRVYSMFPSDGHLTADSAREYVEWVVA
jgi:hypothetical protein